MAVKTITIDLEAYEILARRKQRGQSFSQVIKQELGKTCQARDLRAALPSICLANDTLDAVKREMRKRSESPARAPKITR